ncbi:MAG: helix-turn-helix transcriptional regulator [Lachnospiraceae bacterium]|jgi:putative transcriptional regulator|nr:helix-turn-helix transcriptional regulator [Lachnospiraceae bacterium]
MAVKSNLKQIRTDRNIQQHELAAALQTDVRTISRYETGARCPNIEMALRLSAYFKIAVNQLFELEDIGHTPQ